MERNPLEISNVVKVAAQLHMVGGFDFQIGAELLPSNIEPCICEIGDECHLDRLHEIRGYKITRLSMANGDKGGKVECTPIRADEVLDILQLELAMELASHEVVY